MEEMGDLSMTMALFENFTIRRTWREGRWYFSVVDIMAPLSGTSNPRRYWSDLKRKLKTNEQLDVYEKIVHIFPLPMSDGRIRKTDCADMEGVLRLIQSIVH